jgi:hypothetical protein
MMCATRAAVAAIAWLIVAAASVTAQTFDYSASLQYSSGEYVFTEPTHTWTLYNSLGLRSERLRFSVGLPLVLQNTSAVTYVGGVALPTGGPDYRNVRDRESGESVPMGSGGHGSGQHDGRNSDVLFALAAGDSVVGPGSYVFNVADPSVSGAATVYQGWGMLRSVELTVAAKVPVQSLDSGIGTGEWDYGGGLAVTLGVGRVLFFGDASYWQYGDLPELELLDGMSYAAGVGVPVGERVSVMAAYSHTQQIIETVDPYTSLTVMGSRRVGATGALNAGLGMGLSEASPDFSFSLGWRLGLGRAASNSGGRVSSIARALE